MRPQSRFASFADFYPFYLQEHRNRTSRRLHVVGTGLALAVLGASLLTRRRYALAAPLVGYGFAWLGHYGFEKNRPATFRHPIHSLRGDLRLFVETATGKRPW
ncbi:MAG: Mpo1-like protein [Caulobacteraceae bacterium]